MDNLLKVLAIVQNIMEGLKTITFMMYFMQWTNRV